MKKQLYEQPLAEIFEVHLQANVLQDGSPVNQFSNQGTETIGYDSEEDL